MSIQQIQLANTFDTWRIRTNQLITVSNDLTEGNLLTTGTISIDNPSAFGNNVSLNVKSGMIYGDGGLLSNVGIPGSIQNSKLANSTITVSFGNQIILSKSSISLGDSIFLNVSNLVTNVNDVSTSNIASANAVNAVHVIATQANSRSLLAYDKANLIAINVAAAYDTANIANINALLAIAPVANLATSISLTESNTQSAFLQANTARNLANVVFDRANLIYDFANTRFSSNGGTISGNVIITGELVVAGNTTLLNTSSLDISDPLIYLAANNNSSDVVDIGFVGNYVNTGGQNVYTGFFRDATTKEYYVFDSYNLKPLNEINPSANEFRIAVLNSSIRTSNLILNGQNTTVIIKNSYDVANSASNTAIAAYNHANSGHTLANTANVTAISAFGQANNTLTVAALGYNKANAVSTNSVTSRLGVSGDIPGQIAITNTHIYFSMNTYNGSTNVWRSMPLSGEFNDESPYLMAPYFYGTPIGNATIFMHVATADFYIPISANGSYFKSQQNATADTVLQLSKNGANVGIIRISSASNTGTFNVVSRIDFTKGDTFTVVNNPVADATLTNIAMSFLGYRK